jgi:hypothetical protein
VAYCIAFKIWLGAVAAALAVLSSLIAAWAYRAAGRGMHAGPLGGPYGNGPYRKAECGPSLTVVSSLAEVARKLRELPEKQPNSWQIEWQIFDASRERAAAAMKGGRPADAVREYCRAIRYVMQQFCDHRPMIEDASGVHETPT